jgi:hypothetical protein
LGSLKIGFKGSYKYLHEESMSHVFDAKKWVYIAVSTVAWLAFGATALLINFYFGAGGENHVNAMRSNQVDPKDPGCKNHRT